MNKLRTGAAALALAALLAGWLARSTLVKISACDWPPPAPALPAQFRADRVRRIFRTASARAERLRARRTRENSGLRVRRDACVLSEDVSSTHAGVSRGDLNSVESVYLSPGSGVRK
jgi:hypothetical protein